MKLYQVYQEIQNKQKLNCRNIFKYSKTIQKIFATTA